MSFLARMPSLDDHVADAEARFHGATGAPHQPEVFDRLAEFERWVAASLEPKAVPDPYRVIIGAAGLRIAHGAEMLRSDYEVSLYWRAGQYLLDAACWRSHMTAHLKAFGRLPAEDLAKVSALLAAGFDLLYPAVKLWRLGRIPPATAYMAHDFANGAELLGLRIAYPGAFRAAEAKNAEFRGRRISKDTADELARQWSYRWGVCHA